MFPFRNLGFRLLALHRRRASAASGNAPTADFTFVSEESGAAPPTADFTFTSE